MSTFEYRHDASLGQDFVNGGYELGEVRRLAVAGRQILYRSGSALLDNSCCGSFGCAYALVIGEELRPPTSETACSLVREIAADAPLAETIRHLLQAEGLGVVNFYLRAQPTAEAA